MAAMAPNTTTANSMAAQSALTRRPTPLEPVILGLVEKSGRIPFAEYMALCFYQPDYGYYARGRGRTGVRGDYFTSSDLHPVFARLIARQAAEMWEILGKPAPFTWVEMGAGRGLFAVDFIEWIRDRRPDLFATLDYVLIEATPSATAASFDRLRSEGLDRHARSAAALEDLEPVTGCFFSNELVDALPVAVVTRRQNRLREIYVTSEGGRLRETTGPLSDSRIAAAVARYAPALEEGARAEVSLSAARWIRAVGGKLARGFVLTIDYGDLSTWLYSAARPRGTLLAYQGHTASEDFFAAPGEQDLTAHVNFSLLIDEGRAAGLEPTGFTTQERFLMALGEGNQFADLEDAGATEAERVRARLKLKTLINPETPGGMGTVFKVLIQHRGLASPDLTGLKFCRAIY
jgi:SAM-dependent MidA family methyltransferase